MLGHIPVLLLLALPASGKSEVRKYLRSLDPETRRKDFRLGELVELDDYPYVEFMRKVDEVATRIMRMDDIFYQGEDRPFKDPWEWITLIELLNRDYNSLTTVDREYTAHGQAAMRLFDHINAAQRRAGASVKLRQFPPYVLEVMAGHLNDAAWKILESEQFRRSSTLDSKTVVIEFSRGGAYGATMPLSGPYGYRGSLSRLSPDILTKASVLHVSVTPEDSFRRNAARAVPPPGCADTGIYHGVPTSVMIEDYGCDDIGGQGHMMRVIRSPTAVLTVEAHGITYNLAAA